MRLAFIGGCGHSYLKRLLKNPAYTFNGPIAVASDGIDTPRAKEFANNLGVATTFYESAEEMLDDVKPEVVNVGAVYGLAGEVIARVLRRGIPVVSDKPVAGTWEQLTELKRLTAANASARLISEFEYRCRPAIRAARQAVRDGAIGEVVLATAQKSYRFGTRPAWYGDRKKYGSTILWVASHGIDWVHYVTGKRYARVTGRHGNLTHPELPQMEDHTINLYEFHGGGTAAIHADYLRPDKAPTHGDDRLRIVGSKGQLEVLDEKCVLMTNDQPPIDITATVSPRSGPEEMMAAALGESDAVFSTDQSLYIAGVLLHSRDAADKQTWVEIV